jgi:hypothetical protein
MTTDHQPTLPGIATDERPVMVETVGAETLDRIREIRAAGGRIVIMERLTGSNAGWRLRLHWPQGRHPTPHLPPGKESVSQTQVSGDHTPVQVSHAAKK